jgi:hypothetical protein
VDWNRWCGLIGIGIVVVRATESILAVGAMAAAFRRANLLTAEVVMPTNGSGLRHDQHNAE